MKTARKFLAFGRGALLALGLAVAARAGLPEEITLRTPARFEIMHGDKVGGAITLKAGETLALIDTTGDFAIVRYRNLNGRVPIEQTDLPRVIIPAAALPDDTPVTEIAIEARPAAPTAETKPAPPHLPANVMEHALAGKLVRLDGGAVRPFDGARLAGVKFYALYYSASWCAPCREFTPGLVDAYMKIRELYPEFEVVLMNQDRSAGDMAAYMRADQMAWPALRWSELAQAGNLMRYCGDGIPCLVLVDENGEVLSDTNRWGRYVGPNAVLDDTWKILRDYRRKNPRVKA